MTCLRWICLVACALVAGPAAAGTCRLLGYGTFPVSMVDGQATTVVKINGNDTRFVVDTGNFFNAMSRAKAASLGLQLRPAPFGLRVTGVGGDSQQVQFAVAKKFSVLGTPLEKVAFIVGGTDMGGLLGANLLDIADMDVDLAHGKLTLFKPDHCGKSSLAYWAKDGRYEMADIAPRADNVDRRTFLDVKINGRTMRAMLDSGAYATVLSSFAARRLGVDLDSLSTRPATTVEGVGRKPTRAWTIPVDSLSVGTETIRHTQMQVIDGGFGDGTTDLLLGVDFFLSHHMFIANSQGKIYFTYNGGRVFSLASAPADNAVATAGAADKAAAPLASAADYALRGQAHLARGEPDAALADLDAAVRMEPDHAVYYLARARIHASKDQADAEMADLDKSLVLDGSSADARLMRADLRRKRGDRDGAAADVAAAAKLVPAGSAQTLAIATEYFALDQPVAALPLLDAWIGLHPHDAMLGQALNQRCWSRALANRMLDDALRDCRKSIHMDSTNADFLDSLGMVQLRLGHYAESIRAYQQALASTPHSAWSLYGLGLAQLRSGQAEAGNASLAAARKVDPRIADRFSHFGMAPPTSAASPPATASRH